MVYASDLIQMNVGQIFQRCVLPDTAFTGQTIVVTGANTGLGFEAAKHYLSLNASHIIMACRNSAKAERARDILLASTGSNAKVEVWQLDMSENASVLAFGDHLKQLPRIDAFHANAGIDVNEWSTSEGNESTLTVNVISTILVAMLALPILYKTSKLKQKPAHLIFTGSVVHIFARHQYLSEPPEGRIFETLNDMSSADMQDRYHLSKLLLLMGTRQLAEKVTAEMNKEDASVVVNYVNPGWCKTDLFRSNDGGLGGRIGLFLIGRSAEEGSRTLVHAATAGNETHGKYLSECRLKPESSFMRTGAATLIEKRVWLELLDIIETIRPTVTTFKF